MVMNTAPEDDFAGAMPVHDHMLYLHFCGPHLCLLHCEIVPNDWTWVFEV